MNLKVIYEDNHLLVCEKPVNMPVQADESGDMDLLSLAKAYIKKKYEKPGEVYLGMVHRLDRPVGGVIVFARTSKAAARLTDNFKKKTAKKKYAAIVTGNPKDYGHLRDHIIREDGCNLTRIVKKDTPGAKEASLDFACVTKKDGLSLMDIELHTGRHHQIRVQLANIGCPIYGDQRYNLSAKVGQQIALHAYSLTIEHPTLKTAMTFTSIPTGGAWTKFSNELSALSWGIRMRYIDENLIVVNKNAGIGCTEADRDTKDNDEATVEMLLLNAMNDQRIYPVHRLDVPTHGLIMFARNKSIQMELARLIGQRKIRKIYHAECFGQPQNNSGRLTLYAIKNSEEARIQVYDQPIKNSMNMITDYRVLSSNGTTSIIELSLVTGRTHQIRASLAHIGCPIVGDDRYGDRILNRKNKTGLRLASVELVFPQYPETLMELSGLVIKNDAEFEIDRLV